MQLGVGARVTIFQTSDLEGPVGGTIQCGYERDKWGYLGGVAYSMGRAFGLPHPPGCNEDPDSCDWSALMTTELFYDYPDMYLTDEDVRILMESPFIHRVQEVN